MSCDLDPHRAHLRENRKIRLNSRRSQVRPLTVTRSTHVA